MKYYILLCELGAVRIDDYKYQFTMQPTGWLGGTVLLDWPLITNLRLDPFERVSSQGVNPWCWAFWA